MASISLSSTITYLPLAYSYPFTSSSGVTARLHVGQDLGIAMRELQGLCRLFMLMRDAQKSLTCPLPNGMLPAFLRFLTR